MTTKSIEKKKKQALGSMNLENAEELGVVLMVGTSSNMFSVFYFIVF